MIDFYHKIDNIRLVLADVVELVDTLDLGSSAVRCGSSSLPIRTNYLLVFGYLASPPLFQDLKMLNSSIVKSLMPLPFASNSKWLIAIFSCLAFAASNSLNRLTWLKFSARLYFIN